MAFSSLFIKRYNTHSEQVEMVTVELFVTLTYTKKIHFKYTSYNLGRSGLESQAMEGKRNGEPVRTPVQVTSGRARRL